MFGKSFLSDRTIEFGDVDAGGRKLVTWVFGGKHGVAVFLGALVFFSLTWRVGILSSDNYVIANSVVAIADGHFHIEQIIFGPPDGVTPGTYTVDGRLYGRNYGLVVPAVVVYLLLQTVSLLFDLRILLAGGWSLMILAFAVVLGDLFGTRDRATAVGAGLAFLLFASNVLTATPLDPYWLPVVALQMVTALGAAILAVVTYRLVSAVYDRRLGLFAGFATALGTPVGFWATFPKRHSLSALFVVLTVYTLYRSRSASTGTWQTRFRGLAYAWVGLLAWVHAAEGLVLFIGLLAIDVPTAPRNGIRQLTLVGGVFLVSLIPFALTNTLIAGTPFQAPRMLDAYAGVDVGGLTGGGGSGGTPGGGGSDGSPGGGGSDGSPGGGGSDGSPGGGGTDDVFSPVGSIISLMNSILSLMGSVLALVNGVLFVVIRPMTILVGEYSTALSDLLKDPSRFSSVFLRRGYVSSIRPGLFKPIQLSVLESMPLLGTLAVVPVYAWRRLRSGFHSLSDSPVRVTDGFVLVVILLWVGLYLSRLPLHFQYTVRYLHPIYPLGIYLLVRLPVVRTVLSSHPGTAVSSYIVTVVLGVAIYIIALSAIDAVVSEAVQFYAVVAFVLGIGVAVWALTATSVSYVDRLGAVVLGIATASMTVYILVSGFVTFAYTNEYLLPIGRLIAESLRFVNPFGYLF